MGDLVYPTAIALRSVAQENAPRLRAGRVIFDIMPLVDTNDDLLAYEQKDNYIGLQQVRGLNGEPTRVKHTGGKRYLAEPGYYGEYELIDEREITRRRPFGDMVGGVINVSDLVVERQDKLQVRELDRQELIGWSALQGTFSVSDGSAVLQTDSWTPQTFAAGVPWATVATATPLADLRAVQLKARGYSVNFGAQARMYLNRSTFNAMLSNTNPNDLGGRRGSGLSTINGPAQVNELLAMDDLPTLVIYDQGYYDETATFQLFVPNNKFILVGARTDGDPVMEYRMTRNASNPNQAPGSYTLTIESERPPKTLEVHRGHNGGPVILHAAAIVVGTV
jgi:hypothetical protein